MHISLHAVSLINLFLQAIEEVQVKEDVIEELDELHTKFHSLTKDVKNEIESEVEQGNMTTKSLVRHTEDLRAFPITSLQSVKTTEDFFQAIMPHYNFLNCYLIVSLAMLLSGSIITRANRYSDAVKTFKKDTRVKCLHKTLKHYHQMSRNHPNIVIVSITLEDAWGDQSMWLVEVLVQTLFPTKHPDEYQWFEVIPGSLVVTFLVASDVVKDLDCNEDKIQFMRLVGITRLQVGDNTLLKERENKLFTFENSLMQAVIDSNTEVVQFVLKHTQVDVNTQIIQPMIESFSASSIQCKTELTAIKQLKEFQKSFVLLVKDVEQEIRNAFEDDLVTAEKLLKSGEFPNSTKTMEEIIRDVKGCNFLNYHFIVSLGPLLSHPLAQRVKHYSSSIELFKMETKVSYLNKQLEVYEDDFSRTGQINISIVLENAWRTCSVLFVEQLLQLLFSPIPPNVFHWFRVEAGSVSVVFLAPAHLYGTLMENSMKKQQFMSLTGIISLQLGGLILFRKNEDVNYSFETKGIDQAKTLGDNETLNFLLQITYNQTTTTTWKTDDNKNYNFLPEPGSTPLMIACCNNDTGLIKLLLDNNADPNVKTKLKFTAIMYASRNIRHFKMLQSYNADINAANFLNESVLHWACMTGSVGIAQIIISNSSESKNMKTSTGKTPLHIASDQGHLKIVECLLQAQADPDIQDSDGRTALYIASYNGHLHIVKRLLWAQAESNLFTNDYETPLSVATINGYSETVEVLLEAGADPEYRDNDGATLLYIASHRGHSKIVEIFLQAQLDPNLSTNDGMTPLFTAIDQVHLQVIELLLQAFVNPNTQTSDGRTPLYIATCHNQLKVVQQLLQAQADPNIQTSEGEAPLHIASYHGKLQIVENLLKAQADPNIQDNEGRTPLYIASSEGHLQVVKELVQAQADPNNPCIDGKTPLLIASFRGNSHIVKQLLQVQVDCNMLDNQGNTALYKASSEGHHEVVKQLLKAQADPYIQDSLGKTPLHAASYEGHHQVVKQFVHAKVDPNIQDRTGKTPLHVACFKGHEKVVKLLLKTHANPNLHNNEGRTPLHVASCEGHQNIINQLLQAQADPNIQDNQGRTPLLIASSGGHQSAVEQLLQSQADQSIQDNEGRTPLYIASSEGHLEVIKQLLQAQVDLNISNAKGMTPLQILSMFGHIELVETVLLRQSSPTQRTKSRCGLL